jgi:hypothetical protein
MPPPISRTRAESSLRKKGFRQDMTHHRMWYFYTTDGKKTDIYTYISHHRGEIGNTLLRAMAAELRLSLRQAYDLLTCPLDREGYEAILRQQGFL